MPNDDAVGKGRWGGENVSKSDDVILVRSLNSWKTLFLTCINDKKVYHHKIPYMASNVPMTLNSTIVIIQALIDHKGLSLWGSIQSYVVNILNLSTNYTYIT